MRAAQAALLPFLWIAACAPDAEPTAAPTTLALDCAKPFEDQARAIASLPGIEPAAAAGEPYDYFNAEGGQTSYVITRPEAPAHPAILIQQVEAGAQHTTGCPYGDRKAYETLAAYIQGLGAAKGGRG